MEDRFAAVPYRRAVAKDGPEHGGNRAVFEPNRRFVEPSSGVIGAVKLDDDSDIAPARPRNRAGRGSATIGEWKGDPDAGGRAGARVSAEYSANIHKATKPASRHCPAGRPRNNCPVA